MALTLGANQSPRITTLALNSVGRKGDPGAGVPVTTANVSGSIVQQYLGMVGGKLTLSQSDAATLSDTSTGTLYGGIYMYVLFSATSLSTAARGCVVMWTGGATGSLLATGPFNCTVTPDGTTTNIMFPAGIALNPTTKGNYDFIQVSGVASVKYPSAIGVGTPAIGDAIFISSNILQPQLVDDREGVTVSTTLLKQFIGVAVVAPVASATSAVLMDNSRFVY